MNQTIASLIAAKTPVRIFVCEASYGARREILRRLAALGGAQGGAEFTVVNFEGGVEVTLFHESHQSYGLRCDVAVGFLPASSARLLDGSPIGLAVSADDAAKFWGLA